MLLTYRHTFTAQFEMLQQSIVSQFLINPAIIIQLKSPVKAIKRAWQKTLSYRLTISARIFQNADLKSPSLYMQIDLLCLSRSFILISTSEGYPRLSNAH